MELWSPAVLGYGIAHTAQHATGLLGTDAIKGQCFAKVAFKYPGGLFCWVGHGQFLQFHLRILVVEHI